jgi:hypothetical protein
VRTPTHLHGICDDPNPRNHPLQSIPQRSNMAESPRTTAQPIPPSLSQLVVLNVEYGVLICASAKCRYALKPTTMSRHLGDRHQTPIVLRKQVDQYVAVFLFAYDYTSVLLPRDGTVLQPIVPIVDGFVCKECVFKSVNRRVIRQHANKAHNQKRVADEDVCRVVRLQSWFGEKRERYWVVDESKQDDHDRQIRRTTIQDVGEESDESEAYDGDRPDNNDDNSQDEIDDQIIQDIEKWKAEARERRLQALKNVPVVEMDSWHQYTRWNDVLSRSKHNMVKTFQYTRDPDGDDRDDESKLCRVMRTWSRILERCLDTLAATDYKDALKWWASPKNEAADQRLFELPQNAKSVAKYSRFYEGMICYMMRTAPKEHWDDETGR